MKKVLTLMGALSVAGSAIAHDYLWNMSDLSDESWASGFTKGALTYNGDDNSSFNNKVLGVVSSVKGSDSNNCFKFIVQPGDIVTVHAITVENNVAYIDFTKCKLCRKCVLECPTGAIHDVNFPKPAVKPAPKPAPAAAPNTAAEAAPAQNKPVTKEEK